MVSGDEDWQRSCAKHKALVYVRHLSEMLDKAIRAEWLSDDLWSDEELLELALAKQDVLKPMLENALTEASRVNLGDGNIESLTLDYLGPHGLAITDIRSDEEKIEFGGELFHSVHYSADVSIEDEQMHNTLEDQLSGSAELVASITLVLSLSNPKDIEIVRVDYPEGLSLHIPMKY